MAWSPDIRQSNEAGKVRFDVVQYTRGKVLDLGPGPFKAFRHFIGVDNISEFKGFRWTPDINRDCSDLSIFATGAMDAVFSSHLLEHLEDTDAVLREWWRVIRVDGHLVLYLPHKLFYPNKGDPYANPDHLHDFMPDDITDIMKTLPGGWDLVENEDRNEGEEYSFLQVYKKRADKQQTYPYKAKKPKKTCAVVRYGGIGDCMQASSVLPGLKRQGYHITFHTTPHGYKFLKNDPHIDDWYIVDPKQVNEAELREYWIHLSKKYDKWVNLTEIVEAILLPTHYHTPFYWPHSARHRLCDINYLELSHLVADVPLRYETRFYPSPEEKKWAESEKKQIGKCVLWTIAGSSLHKIWPYMDGLIARILLEVPDLKIVLVGDEPCEAMIEPVWKEEPRVLLRSNKWTVRESLAFAQVADIVMGPETGILNSVSLMWMPKLIWLSHSSVENLTRDWKNTVSLIPEGCRCYPCHKLLSGSEFCDRDLDNTGTSLCQSKISLDAAWEAFCNILGRTNFRTEPRIWQETRTLITP